MAQFVLYVATSLDGYIARSDGSLDWLPTPDEAQDEDSYTQFYETVDALVMGATTYEQVLGFGDEWPYPGKLTYVLTHRDQLTQPTDPKAAIALQPDVKSIISDAKQQNFQRIWLVGGGSVAAAFMQQGLIDEYVIVVIPILLGEGISLYQSIPEIKLKLINSQSFSSGAVELHYSAIADL
ncbi:MAG: dihydrofolate reductase family protein [Thainema sp.]